MDGEESEPEGPHIMTHFGKRLAELAGIDKGAWILDLGMGLGSSLFPAAEKVGKNGQVIGIDISDEMVRGTYERIKNRKITNAKVIQTDARTLIFKDNMFDAVLSGFSFLYSTMEEIRRVLKEGGQFGLTTWKTLEDMEWMASFLRRYMPVNSKEVYHQDTTEGLRNLLDNAGFKNVTVLTEKKEFAYVNEEQWWEDMNNSGWRDHLEKIENVRPGNLEKFKKEAFERLQVYKHADGIHFTAVVLFAFGIK